MKTYEMRVFPVCGHCIAGVLARRPKVSLEDFKYQTDCGEQDGRTYQIEAENEGTARVAAAGHYHMDDPLWQRLGPKMSQPYRALMVIHNNRWRLVTP